MNFKIKLLTVGGKKLKPTIWDTDKQILSFIVLLTVYGSFPNSLYEVLLCKYDDTPLLLVVFFSYHRLKW